MAAAERDLGISQESQAKLTQLTSLLHLFHHRNKNQHRHSIWYRHFSIFRKQLNQLISSIASLNSVPVTNLARTQKKRTDAKILADHAKRMVLWRDVLVPKWQHAFGQLVADGRFAVLGVVLMACLAEFCQIVGITAELEELGQVEVEMVLEEFGREEWGEEGGSRVVVGEDQGEVVRREEEEGEPAGVVKASEQDQPVVSITPETAKTTTKASKKRSSHAPEKRTKKKRQKTGNAIDDIFG